MMILTIFTPSYNRGIFLPIIYKSLCCQDFTDFEWLIIDDGSTDNTQVTAKQLISQHPSFTIRYIYKENGGKHTAINLAAKESQGKYILWLDSDDRLLPNSLIPFINKLKEAESDTNISAVVGLRVGENMRPLGNYVPIKDEDVRFLKFVVKKHIKGDYSWAIKKDILKKYPYPIYNGENFCTEGVVLNRISEDYLTRFVNIPVIIGDYIDGGLTARLHTLTKNNPFGFLRYYKDMIDSRQTNIIFRFKISLLYWNRYLNCKKKIPLELEPNTFLQRTKIVAIPIVRLYNIYKSIGNR